MNEEDKKTIIHDLNIRIGGDINDLSGAYNLENELHARKNYLHCSLNIANFEVPGKPSPVLSKADQNCRQIENLKAKSEKFKLKVQAFLDKTAPLQNELDKRISVIAKLHQVTVYLKTFQKIEDLSNYMKQINDDEHQVIFYGALKDMCRTHEKGHKGTFVKEYTRHWHNILKDRLSKNYQEVMALIKWPFPNKMEHSPPSKELMTKFSNLTRHLFLIQEPEDASTSNSDNFQENTPCLPVRVLLIPLKKRFAFHFTGSRQTARIDRPEWFLTQTLTWIRDHQGFVYTYVQPVANKLGLKNVKAVDEFNNGLLALAAERLHTVLALYNSHAANEEIVDADAAFAHVVDETLGFQKELMTLTGKEFNVVLSVLTKAEIIDRWLALEKKYALVKLDETLSNEQWSEAVAAGIGAAVGTILWVPRGADWFISLLKTIEERYTILPQPGHRLRFLELQLELLEEWRVRLTQLMSAALNTLKADSFMSPGPIPQPIIAIINAAHHTRNMLLQWAHSIHYLQLHYYRAQFHHFTKLQHQDEISSGSNDDDHNDSNDNDKSRETPKAGGEQNEAMSLNEVEDRAKKLALSEVSRRNSMIASGLDLTQLDITMPIANLAVTDPLPSGDHEEEAGVFGEAPALFVRLRDSGLTSLAEHILYQFKAGMREYKRQKWHGLVIVESIGLSISPPLCGPLSGLCARMSSASASLAPALATKLRADLSSMVDKHIYEDLVLECWFNTGGTIQFTHDVQRNLVPAFAPPKKLSSQINQLPKLMESCKLLNMDYDDARRLRNLLSKQPSSGAESLKVQKITHISPNEALQILNQRTDLSDASTPSSVMELF